MLRRVVVVLLFVGLVVALAWAASTGGWPVPGASDSTEASGSPGDTSSTVDTIPGGASEATVEYVHDGDTIFLDDGRKVRLLGINTPEIGDNAECWGDEATAALRATLPEGTRVWVLSDVEPLDQYGRSLLWVFLPDGTNVNLQLVRDGDAEVEQYAPNWLYRDELRSAEADAERDGLGLWGSC